MNRFELWVFPRSCVSPSDGAETGGAEPHIAEQSRSWRAASGEWEVMRGSLSPSSRCRSRQCRNGGSPNLWPIGESQIGGDQQRRLLIEFADQVEQQLSAGLTERQIVQLVDDDDIVATQ